MGEPSFKTNSLIIHKLVNLFTDPSIFELIRHVIILLTSVHSALSAKLKMGCTAFQALLCTTVNIFNQEEVD